MQEINACKTTDLLLWETLALIYFERGNPYNFTIMYIDDNMLDDVDLDTSDIEHLDFVSSFCDDNDSCISGDEDSFVEEIMNEYHQMQDDISFCGRDTLPSNASSDGYIPSGHQELTSTVSEIPKTFKLYSKGGHDYVLHDGKYYRIDGTGTVTIGGIKYDKI